MDDQARWDEIHKRIHEETDLPSNYAVEKEKLFPRGCLVVDLGGGTGNDALYFLQQGHSVVVLDISEFALKVSEEKAQKYGLDKRLAVKQVDFGLHELPIKDNSVDIVYSRISLNYFGRSHTTKLFSDIYHMLKPGGSTYLTFKSPDDVHDMEFLENTGTLYEENVYIENGQLRSRFTVDQLLKFLQDAGIAGAQVSPYVEKLHSGTGNQENLYANEIVFSKPMG